MCDSEFELSCHEDSDDSDSSSSPPKKKIKPNVLHENVVVQVDGKMYPLNRVQLALKSNYFEKLFVENFAEKNSDVVEIRGLNSDTFSAIVDLINGKDLKSVMNADNYLDLLMGMDYLQMEIDLETVKCYIVEDYYRREGLRPLDVKIIGLYHFTTVNQNYRYLEIKILKYISAHLIEIIKHDEKFILSLPFEQFLRMIRKRNVMWCEFFGAKTVHAKQKLSQICSNWICHDAENRLQHFTTIVNAANYGFYADSFLIPSEKVEPFFDEIKKDTSRERIEKCFLKLFGYRGEINPEVGQFRLGEELHKNRIVNKINERKKLSKFLHEGHLSDVTIKAGAKTYKLHRYILDTASTYFSGSIPTSNKNSELVVDVSEKTFDLIVDFIYFDKIPNLDSILRTDVMQILKAASTLKSKLVIEKCCVPWMEKFKEVLTSKDITELLNLTVSNDWQSEIWVTNVLRSFIDLPPENAICKDIFPIWQICEAAGLVQSSYMIRHQVTSAIDKMNYENLVKTFHVICEVNDAGNYSYLYIACLCKLIVAPKSDSSVESHFVSISCDVLEDLLVSEYFVISDPQKIVDICSKWIVHDVENRYRLIPRIVFAINQNNSMDFGDFEINIPADLSNCSQQVVNEELWKLLNSNCLLPRDLGSEQTSWDFKSRPMFILPKGVDDDTRIPKEVCVVDSEINEIVSLNFLLNHYDVPSKRDRLMIPRLSATLIGGTLFVLCEIRGEFRVYAYNFSSKKLNVLGSTLRTMYYPMDTLLNCNNQLFWCFDDGRVMKYSIELNRWLAIYSDPESGNHGPYSSDGKKLFRYHRKCLQTFDFERSSWAQFADLPSYSRLSEHRPMHITNLHDGFAFSFNPMLMNSMLLFNSNIRSWKLITTPGKLYSEFNAEMAQYEEDLLYAHSKGIQHLARASFLSGTWRLMKPSSEDFELTGIVAIHYTP